MLNNTGLTNKEVNISRNKYGSNSINGKNKSTFISLFIETLGDPIIKILLIALFIKVIFLFKDFDYFETIGIVVAILVASLISAVSEYGSNKAFQRMQEESSKINIKVKRNGNITEIPIDDIVVGDIVLLSSGDKVPADITIISGKLSVDESSLNGEAKEVYKEKVNDINKPMDINKIYRGTTIYDGAASGVVTKVGMDTLYGKMAKSLVEKEEDSPLKIRLTNLAKIISRIGYVAATMIAISYLFSKIFILNNFNFAIISNISFNTFIGYLLEALTLAVSVLVMSVPEGLPMMITLVLSSNMKRMLKDNILVRKLVGIETSGSLNILFTDKTGTLTKGELEVIGMILGDGKVVNSNKELISHKKYLRLLDESLIQNNSCSYDKVTKKFIGGNATDQACVNFISNKKPVILPKIKEKPFNSKDKYSKVVVNDNGNITYIKGSPELLLKKCSKYLSLDGRETRFISSTLLKKLNEYTKCGIRVILTGYSKNDSDEIVLLSLLLIKDELRKESKGAVSIVQNAGVQVVMITGDNKETATSIAREVGIIKNSTDLVLTSTDLANMSDSELKKNLRNLRVVARALPQDKSRLVRISEEEELVVGMTGDGVNDAPALKKADVGFAMNSGTEVAKEASDIILLDNNFYSITKAILYGRTIFKSIRKFIIFQLTVNFCAVFLSIIGPFIGVATPVTVIQMLWINMVMDTLAGIAFSYEAPLLEYMEEKPKDRYEPILNNYMIHEIVFIGIYSSLLCIFFLKSPYIHSFFRTDINDKYFLTAFFGLFIFISIFNSFNARTSRLNIFANLFKNRMFMLVILFIVIVQFILIYYGGELFRTVGLSFKEIEIMLFCAFSVIPVELFRKICLKRKHKLGHV